MAEELLGSVSDVSPKTVSSTEELVGAVSPRNINERVQGILTQLGPVPGQVLPASRGITSEYFGLNPQQRARSLEEEAFQKQYPGRAATSALGRFGLQLAGTTGGPVAAGLGFSAAENLGDVLDVMLGKPSSKDLATQTPTEAAKKTAINATIGALLQKGAELAPSAIEGLANIPGKILRKGTVPEALQAAKEAESLGIILPAGTTTRAPAAQVAQKTLEIMPGAGSAFDRAYAKVENQLTSAKEKTLSSIGAQTEKLKSGEAIKEAIRANERQFQSDAEKAYEPYLNVQVDKPISNDSIPKILKDIEDNFPEAKGTNLEKTLKNLISIKSIPGLPQLQGTNLARNPQLQSLLSKTKTLDFKGALNFSKRLGDLGRDLDSSGKSTMARLAFQAKSAIDSDIDNSIKNKLGNNAFNDYLNTKEWYGTKKKFFDSLKTGKINEADAEKISDIIVDPNSATYIKQLKDTITPNQFKIVQREFANRFFEDPEKFLDNVDTLKEVFTPSQLEDLKKILRVQETAQGFKLSKEAARTIAAKRYLIGTLTTTGAGLNGILIHHPIATSAMLLSGKPLANLFLSDTGRKYLLEGLTLPAGSRKAVEIGSKLISLAGGVPEKLRQTESDLEKSVRNSISEYSR